MPASSYVTCPTGVAFYEGLHLECDGMTKVLSAVLVRDGIDHRCMVGSLTVAGVGKIPLHHWIELPDGSVIDLRARMWIGDDELVPYGAFLPGPGVTYDAHGEARQTLMPLGFFILVNMDLASAPSILLSIPTQPK